MNIFYTSTRLIAVLLFAVVLSSCATSPDDKYYGPEPLCYDRAIDTISDGILAYAITNDNLLRVTKKDKEVLYLQVKEYKEDGYLVGTVMQPHGHRVADTYGFNEEGEQYLSPASEVVSIFLDDIETVEECYREEREERSKYGVDDSTMFFLILIQLLLLPAMIVGGF